MQTQENYHESQEEKRAREAQGKNFFKTSLTKVGTTPITTHIGEILPTNTSPDIRGAEKLFSFLVENKREFKHRMKIDPPNQFNRSALYKSLECLPKMAIGRFVW